ncbi:hypothetical protein V2G26_012814 [Clonostachys chloroleuca]
MAMQGYAVCYRCRRRKIRCGRERPHCLNCVNAGYECDWSGRGKKPNQSSMLLNAISDLSRRLEKLEDITADMFDVVARLNAVYPPNGETSNSNTPPQQAATQHKAILPQTERDEHQGICSEEDLSQLCNFNADEQLQYFRARIGEQHGLGSRFGPLYPTGDTFNPACQSRKEYPDFSSSHSSITDLTPTPLPSALPTLTQQHPPSSAHGSVDEFGQTLSGSYYIPADFCPSLPDSR